VRSPPITLNGSTPSKTRARADTTAFRGPPTLRSASGAAGASVFVVHSLTQAVAAASATAEAGRPVVIASAADAGIYAGPGWFKAVIDAVRAAAPAAQFSAVLDCGDDAGAVQSAIRAGIDAIVFTGRADVAARLQAIAEESNSRILTERPQPAHDLLALFFADGETVRRRCAEILAGVAPICYSLGTRAARKEPPQ
jgi:hypothetical protein